MTHYDGKCFEYIHPSVSWILAAVAAIPYLLFTEITLAVADPSSGVLLEESAMCAMWRTPEVDPPKLDL